MPAEIRVPPLGESIVEATVGRWLKREGEPVAVGEPVVVLETEKVSTEVAADEAGGLERILRREGETVRPGDVLGTIALRAAAAPPAPAPPAARPAPPPAPLAPVPEAAEEEKVRASSLAQRLAAEFGVDLARVPGTGPGGRVTREDVEAYARRAQAPAPPAPGAPPRASVTPPPSPAPAAAPPAAAPAPPGRAETRQRLSRRRLTIARRLVEAQRTAAMLTTFNEIDLSAVVALRQRWREPFLERHGVRLGLMSFFVKAAIGALKAFPQVNGELQGEELVLKHYYDIGIAIGDPEGLVVPVLRDADRMSFAQVEQAIERFVQQARDLALTLEDLRGGTFTLTNGGVYGSLLSTPILNPPQVGILGMHKIEDRPIAVNGQVLIRPMMYVALSYDHRVVDGREAVQFLVRVKELIENPESLLLEG
ncbi:MAG: 2-oxoglutarate dehydrogenase complex dihydrolipoyllysine-residue succinyltransferase [Chloroflexi bacterium]|nr:2-oxoglutarate dehydrogenase complex dihydrolipoyllysine-residue succinyltransferase [Chloroflexota bacterium]